MYADHHWSSFHQFRSKLSNVVVPFQLVVTTPIKLFHDASNYIVRQKTLVADNEVLRGNKLVLQSKLQQLLLLEKENSNLRALLQAGPHIDGKTMVAELVAVGVDPNRKELVLDKGSNDGVFAGQPVIDSTGVVGQVVEANLFASRVLLVTDSRSATPVQNSRTDFRAIAEGSGSDSLVLLHVAKNSNIQQGDLFVTSGLGLRYPAGYPVAKVVSIANKGDSQFLTVTLKPLAYLENEREVLLVWPGIKQLKKSVANLLDGS